MMTTYPNATRYADTTIPTGTYFLVDADGFSARVGTLDAVRTFVAGIDAERGRCRNVGVAKVVNGYVVESKTLRHDWKNV